MASTVCARRRVRVGTERVETGDCAKLCDERHEGMFVGDGLFAERSQRDAF